jgi:hypothetical protein
LDKLIGLVIGSYEKYVFTEKEWLDCDLYRNGPVQLHCWHNVNINNYSILAVRELETIKDYVPRDIWTDEDIALSMDSCKVNREWQYGSIQNIFKAIENKQIDWSTETFVTFYLDDEKGDPGYTKLDNFHAEAYHWDTVYPNHNRNWGQEYLELVGVSASEENLLQL